MHSMFFGRRDQPDWPICIVAVNRITYTSCYGVHVFWRLPYGVRVFGSTVVHPLQIVVAGPDGFAGTAMPVGRPTFSGLGIMESLLVRYRGIWRKGI